MKTEGISSFDQARIEWAIRQTGSGLYYPEVAS